MGYRWQREGRAESVICVQQHASPQPVRSQGRRDGSHLTEDLRDAGGDVWLGRTERKDGQQVSKEQQEVMVGLLSM